jgi:hypothetical protein
MESPSHASMLEKTLFLGANTYWRAAKMRGVDPTENAL